MFNLLLINYFSWNEIYKLVNGFYSSQFIYKIVIVDNSHDSIDLSKFIPFLDKVIIVSSLVNSGYSGGNNIGLWALDKNQIKGDIIVANSDVSISLNVLDYANDIFLKNKDIGQLYFETYGSDNRLMYNTIKMIGLIQKWHTKKSEVELSLSDYAAGSFFFIRRSIIDFQGYIFDERFFMYWEEVDLSLTVKDLGYKVVCSNRYHLNRADNKPSAIINSLYYIVRNSFLIKHKVNVSFLSSSLFYFKIIFMTFKLSFINKSLKPFLGLLFGFYHGLKGRFGRYEKNFK